MTAPAPNPDPDPDRTAGLEPGGGVPPGETPPGESSMSGAGPRQPDYDKRGWATAPVVVIGLFVLIFAVTVFIWAALV
ncbi:DUF6480 family protein [Streptomyces griseocarneus]|uniref:DUF6480 family protein n=1 Tax=Streptomyces griseocarneus TaxID=51201 RepID=UPI00167F02F5|nr:DUF6480 family protein [Streptomyces griseocarneus]MBZ6474925.1 DUF6480 family protein [Streptomyces griseocarneus]